MVDWKRWNMADTFASPEDFFAAVPGQDGQAAAAGAECDPRESEGGRPQHDRHGRSGELRRGAVHDLPRPEAGHGRCVFDGWYPLRWCLFAEPVNVYRKTPVRLEAVLANEDMLEAGRISGAVQVVGPEAKCVFDRDDPGQDSRSRTPSRSRRWQCRRFAEDVVIDGPPGKYRFLVTFERGAAAAGGETEFYVADPAECRRSKRKSSSGAKTRTWRGG